MKGQYIHRSDYRATLDRLTRTREELEQTKKELATLEGRYRVAIADIDDLPKLKAATALAIAEHMLSDCIRLAHELEESRGTKSVARRLRSILGLPPVKQDGEELEESDFGGHVEQMLELCDTLPQELAADLSAAIASRCGVSHFELNRKLGKANREKDTAADV